LVKLVPLGKTFIYFWLNLFLLLKISIKLAKKKLFMAKIISFGKTFCLLAKLLYIFNKPLPFDKTFFSIN